MQPTPASPDLVENLTEREQAVRHYLPSQLTQRDIANELYVSLNTVRTHCKSIYRKLGVGDRKAAVHTARGVYTDLDGNNHEAVGVPVDVPAAITSASLAAPIRIF